MENREQALIKYFQGNKGMLRFSQVVEEGFDPKHLKALVQKGEVEKIGHGLYRFSQSEALSNPDLVTVALKAPKGVICLISALAYHEVTDEIPRHVDVALLRKTRPNKIDYPPVQFHFFSQDSWKEGVETVSIDGHSIKIYNLPKTIADCFKFRNKIGTSVAMEALKTAVAEKKAKPQDIFRYAKVCRVDKIVRPYLETLL